MDLLNNYIEMMGDTEFAIYVASFVFGLIFLIGLLGKWSQMKSRPAAIVPPKGDPKPAETKQKEPIPKGNDLEGVMTWEFDDGKKKKNKTPPPPPLKPVAAVPPPLPVPAEPVPPPPVNNTASDQTLVLPAALAVSPTRPEEKTVILPPKEAKGGTLPTPQAAPSPAVLAKSEEIPGPEKSFVDFQMYETLVRRIAGVEADLKRDPLYLDPLMKRMGNTEKRLEEMAARGPSVPPSEGEGATTSASGELKELKEKVLKLQKLLEQLSEGPSMEGSGKTANTP